MRTLRRYLNAHRRLTGDSLRKTLALYLAAPMLPRGMHVALMRAYRERLLNLERWRLFPAWMPESLRTTLFTAHLKEVKDAESNRQFANEAQHRLSAALDTPETPTIAWGWPIEIWRPYADRRLHEFLLALPPEQLFEPGLNDRSSYGGSKQLLRRSMRGMLPDSIRTRRVPTHFGATVEQDMERHWPRYEAAFGPDSHSVIAERGYVDPHQFWERLQQFRVGGFGPDAFPVYYMVGLETWLRGLRGPRADVVKLSTRVGSSRAVVVHDRDRSELPDRSSELVLERR
jgi:asparagine synthase (glutamine-hydrolysing)